jgi:metal-responsive CopG/Arc/MetJ family transcriptional regulator
MENLNKNKTVSIGVSVPFDLFQKLELARQYESRSHYYSRLLKQASSSKQDIKN